MEKKVVLVTGGTRGIGKAIRELLVMNGYHVIFTGTTMKEAEVVGESCIGMPFSLEDSGFWIGGVVIERLRQHVGERGLYGVVNNAAICETATLGTKEFVDSTERVLNANLRGTALLVNALVGGGLIGGTTPSVIVNISSQLGVVGRAGYSAYSASKAGLIAMTKVWSMELAPKGCRVNAVCPGWIETEMTATDLARLAKEDGVDPAAYRKRLEDSLDLRRFNTPQEVAEIVAFLLSPASSGITGRIIELAGPSA